MFVALLPAVTTVEAQPPAGPAVKAGGRGASELLATGEAAYNAGSWQSAADSFNEFLDDYAGLDGTAVATAKVKPLLAICQVRLGKFDEALPLLDEVLGRPDLDPKQRVDLAFFAGLANLRTGKPAEARKHLGEIFSDTKIERGRRMEALILGGMTYVLEKNWKESISFFKKHREEISNYSPEAGARAKILLLHAYTQEKQWEEAATLAVEIHSKLAEVRQVVTFASMLIEVGAHFLEEDQPYKAISLLRLVPTKDEIGRLQNSRLSDADTEMAIALAAKDAVRAAQMQSAVDEIHRELEAFEKISSFDSAARLRLAGAYFQLGRTREACLILDQMVRQMEPDPIVESATASLIRGWMSLERYPRAATTADLYLERFRNAAETPNLADVMFLKAQALEGQFQYQKAVEGYREVSSKFKDQPIAVRADFMAAYNVLQLEDYKQAGALLDAQLKGLKAGDEMWDHVLFWRAMAFYFDQKWEECRALLATYRTDSRAGEYVDDAEFRIGYTFFAEARYPEAIERLQKFAKDHPQSEWLAEGLLTLGDSLAAEGDLDAAAKAYASIGVEAPGFHDEGWMKRGNLLKVRKDLNGMKALFTEFLSKRSDSQRIAEALHWLGWVAKQQGDLPGARIIYWDAVHRFGNEAARPGLEDIFLGLQTFYSGPDQEELGRRLRDELGKASAAKQRRSATRLGWALAQLDLTKKDSTPEERVVASRKALVALVPEIEPKETAPRILADVGDALAESDHAENAAMIYDGLRKWWPRTPERDRAYAGLGFLAARKKDEAGALAYFDKFEKSSVMPKTAPDEHGISLVEGALGGRVAMARADLLSTKDETQAMNILLAVQRGKSMPAKVRAEAFMKTADIHAARGRYREALPYFEQVYLLFNRFPDLVATAYVKRGEALEKLAMPEKAREVYSELVSREDLAGFEPARLARQRAEALGGIISPKESAGDTIPPSP